MKVKIEHDHINERIEFKEACHGMFYSSLIEYFGYSKVKKMESAINNECWTEEEIREAFIQFFGCTIKGSNFKKIIKYLKSEK